MLLALNLNASCLCFFFKCRGGILNEFYMKEVRLLCGTDKTLELGKKVLTKCFVVVNKRNST